jgi:hypothetical protein
MSEPKQQDLLACCGPRSYLSSGPYFLQLKFFFLSLHAEATTAFDTCHLANVKGTSQ